MKRTLGFLSGRQARRRMGSMLTAGLCLLLAGGLGMVLIESTDLGKARMVQYTSRDVAETGSINVVTGILMDYRGFDTFGEAMVILASVAATAMILGTPRTPHSKRRLGLLARRALSAMLPLFFVFPIYVILFGHLSPGGGFQGGVSLAVVVILIHVTFGHRFGQSRLPLKLLSTTEYVAALTFGSIGLLGIATGSAYLSNALINQLPGAGVIPVLNVVVGIKVAAGLSVIYLYLSGEDAL